MRKIFALLIILLFISCKPLAAKLILGVDTSPEWKSKKSILEDFDKYQIPAENSFILDTVVFSKSTVKKVYENIEVMKANGVIVDSIIYKKIQKSTNDNLQPVQVRYFDQNGSPIFKLVNCYLENIYKMDWNFDKSFDNYPPKTHDELLNFGNENLDFFLPMFHKLDGSKITMATLPKRKYYAVILWNDFYRKPSKKLIKLIQEVEKNNTETFVFFVNNHNAEIYDLIPDEMKVEYLKKIRNLETVK